MDYESNLECQMYINEAVLEVRRVKVTTSEQLLLQKSPIVSEGKYLLTHVATHHFIMAISVSMVDVDALFMGQIPIKILISLVSNEAFVGAWRENPLNIAHMDLNPACLLVDGCPLSAQPLKPNSE